MNLPEKFFHTLIDPNIALILLSIGLLAITIELYTPAPPFLASSAASAWSWRLSRWAICR